MTSLKIQESFRDFKSPYTSVSQFSIIGHLWLCKLSHVIYTWLCESVKKINLLQFFNQYVACVTIDIRYIMFTVLLLLYHNCSSLWIQLFNVCLMAPQASALNKYNDFQALHHIQVYAFQFLSFLFKGWGVKRWYRE